MKMMRGEQCIKRCLIVCACVRVCACVVRAARAFVFCSDRAEVSQVFRMRKCACGNTPVCISGKNAKMCFILPRKR